jgi:SPASM domain peptide maturase of grasp-with-spasm system
MKLKLFSEVLISKGHNRDLLVDVGRLQYFFVPKEIHKIINISKVETNNLDLIKKEYVDFLINNELAFWADDFDLKYVKHIKLNWHSPFLVNNSVFEISNIKIANRIINILEDIYVPNIVIIFSNIESKKEIQEFIDNLNKLSIVNMFLIFKNINNILDNDFISNLLDNSRINNIFINGANNITLEDNRLFVSEKYIEKENNNYPQNFSPFLKHYTESLNFNTYYNKKICIDKEGILKNTLFSNIEFGNIFELSNTQLKQIIEGKEFQKAWIVTKKIIDVCNRCEFQNICNDSRMPYLKSDKKKYYHIDECNYNPFISKWKWEDGYLNLNDSGITSNENEFKINKHRLRKVLKNLWEE